MDLYKIKERLSEAIQEQKDANMAYRFGNAIMTDEDYDDLVVEINDLQEKLGEINPGDDLSSYDPNSVGMAIPDSDDRKEALPIPMASMNKVKSFEEILEWIKLKNIPADAKLVLTPKYDGVAFCVDEESDEAWTRGDGKEGQKSDEHYKATGDVFTEAPVKIYSFGELIMNRKSFEELFSIDAFQELIDAGEDRDDLKEIFGNNEGFANGRNMIAGKVNDKNVNEIILQQANYMRYGMQFKEEGKKMEKSEQLLRLNKMNKAEVPFEIVTVEKLTDEFLCDLFYEWNKEFELDGIIIDVDDPDLIEDLGRDTKGNPHFARAYKNPMFADILESEIVAIHWKLSKQGYLKPRVEIKPVKLNGATVTFVTGNNARFIVNMGIAVGETVKIMRSGMVIPKIIEVDGVKVPEADDKDAIQEAAKLRSHVDVDLPTHCYSCGEEYVWNDNKVELMCANPDCPEQQLERVIAFFDVMDVNDMGEGNVTAFFNEGYDTVEKILKMTQDEMIAIDRFGKRKASKIYNAIHDKMRDAKLEKVQHASGYFKGMGSKKLALLEDMQDSTADELAKVDGIAKKLAEAYLEGYPKFKEFFDKLPITLAVKKVPTSDKFKDQVIVFTGFRNKSWEALVEDGGGRMGSSVSKKTTLLVVNQLGSGSSKESKAESLGVKIVEAAEFEGSLI